MYKERAFWLFSLLVFILVSMVSVVVFNNLKQIKEDSDSSLVEQAILHYKDIVNTRKWNAQYGGVYVKPVHGLVPNPYLKNNILKVDENLTLIKVNPAWMTRQLSELSTDEEYSFRLTSLDPINPVNVADSFEREALTFFESNRSTPYYYRFYPKQQQMRFAGIMITQQACLACHAAQGYKLGDVRGAISITLSTKVADKAFLHVKERAFYTLLLFAMIIVILIGIFHKQLQHKLSIIRLNQDLKEKQQEIAAFNRKLEKEVRQKTDELRAVLDSQSNIIMLSDSERIIAFNKFFKAFFSEEVTKRILDKSACLCDYFIPYDDSFVPTEKNEETFWGFQILKRDPIDRVVTLEDRHGKRHTFNVSIDKYELNDAYLVISLHDITLLAEESKTFEDQASYDPLTNLFNRRKFTYLLQQEIKRVQRYGEPLSAIMLDIDFFKHINDEYGHLTGDKVLVKLATYIKEKSRAQDISVRWGGEEFIILLPHTDTGNAREKAELMCREIDSLDDSEIPHFTISLGVSSYRHDETDDDFIKRLDNALYAAKTGGRNRVCSDE